MSMQTRSWLLGGALAALAIPPLIFLWAALADGLGASEALTALVTQYGAERQNLAVLSAVGLAPLALLTIVLLVMRRLRPRDPARPIYAAAGLLPILLVLGWIHSTFWPLFFPGRTYPGFPHGLEFVVGPFIFAPVAMTVGLLVAWLGLRNNAS